MSYSIRAASSYQIPSQQSLSPTEQSQVLAGPLAAFPNELIIKILGHLCPRSSIGVERVCRTWHFLTATKSRFLLNNNWTKDSSEKSLKIIGCLKGNNFEPKTCDNAQNFPKEIFHCHRNSVLCCSENRLITYLAHWDGRPSEIKIWSVDSDATQPPCLEKEYKFYGRDAHPADKIKCFDGYVFLHQYSFLCNGWWSSWEIHTETFKHVCYSTAGSNIFSFAHNAVCTTENCIPFLYKIADIIVTAKEKLVVYVNDHWDIQKSHDPIFPPVEICNYRSILEGDAVQYKRDLFYLAHMIRMPSNYQSNSRGWHEYADWAILENIETLLCRYNLDTQDAQVYKEPDEFFERSKYWRDEKNKLNAPPCLYEYGAILFWTDRFDQTTTVLRRYDIENKIPLPDISLEMGDEAIGVFRGVLVIRSSPENLKFLDFRVNYSSDEEM